MGFQVYNSEGQELQNLTGSAGGDLTGTYPNPTLAKGPTYVTSLPSSPIDGQEIYYAADATNGVIWHFRYRTAASKWEFVGGPPLVASVATSQTTTSTTYAALTTAGPSIALPLAGDYDVMLSVIIDPGLSSPSFDRQATRMSFDIGATGAVDADGVVCTASGVTSVKNIVRKTGLSAVTLTAKYKTNSGAGAAAGFSNRTIAVLPVRI